MKLFLSLNLFLLFSFFASSQQVIIYEHSNFQGRSKSLGPGQYRLNDFNDIASSVRVPVGMVAYLYEHASDGAGYGIALDLMENCTDLVPYGFNDKLSYINIFPATKDNIYVWGRGANVNGQFVWGHWERKRVNPGPPNNTAAVSPPIPAPVGVGFRNWQWSELSSLPSSAFDQAMLQNQGIVGMDVLFPDIARIGFDPVSVETFRDRPTHRPIDGYKRAHTGMLTVFYRGSLGPLDDDNDMIYYINPNPGDKPFEDFLATGKSKKKAVEGEIDIMDAFAGIIMSNHPPIFCQLTGYGAFVHEKHDYFDTRPHDYIEIHPCENMWTSELNNGKMKYTIGVFSDNSGRFNKWRPNPVVALNAIAFEHQGGGPLRFTMKMLDSHNMVVYPYFNDNTTKHCLMDGNDSLIVIEEVSSPNIFFSIDFAQVSKTPLGNGKFSYKGFMKIHSAVKDGGHALFTVQENRGSGLIMRNEVKVTLQTIKCISVDDGNDTEELYGAYGLSAVTGSQPYHTNLYTTGTTNGILWRRDRTNTLNLKAGQTSTINGVRYYPIPNSGELVLYGNIDEDDGGGDDDDKLGESYLERYYVRDLQVGVPRYVTHIHQSGGTKIEVKLMIERKTLGPARPLSPVGVLREQ